MTTSPRHVGYVTLLGRPSSGKSSFVNAAIGDKISIVSAIPQTTRRLIRGIYTDKNCQIIFQDVPGLHSSSHNWNQSINWVTKSALEDTDIILRIIDGARPKGLEEEMIDTLVLEAKVPVVTIVSKVDTMNEFEKHLYPKGTIFVSSITKEGIKEVIAQLATLLPKGPLLYPEDDITDQDIYTRASEIIREKIFLSTYEEVPHCTYVDVDMMEDKGNLVKILAYIYCMTDSQKKILVGSHGAMIKEIGTLARKDLQDLFEKKVYLDLHVKVSAGWQTRDTITQKILGKK
ncbi:MAG: GTPase Era [Candidatus Gracilibacteria bacterium]